MNTEKIKQIREAANECRSLSLLFAGESLDRFADLLEAIDNAKSVAWIVQGGEMSETVSARLMTPEIRKALETNTLPFGEMPRKLQEALVVAVFLDGIQGFDNGFPVECDMRTDSIYRIAPEPVIYPDYPWDLFDDEIQWMAIDSMNVLVISEAKMKVGGGSWRNWGAVRYPAKFNRGNVDWKDSQMQRPTK